MSIESLGMCPKNIGATELLSPEGEFGGQAKVSDEAEGFLRLLATSDTSEMDRENAKSTRGSQSAKSATMFLGKTTSFIDKKNINKSESHFLLKSNYPSIELAQILVAPGNQTCSTPFEPLFPTCNCIQDVEYCFQRH